ncbi:MAG: RodZ domain-containing protein [Desulfosalsimonas sp.]
MSFGRYLKTIRENRGVSLEELSAEICVPSSQLEVIEAEDLAGMPADVYTKGILRAYAGAVGVDPEDIIERYKQEREAQAKAYRLEKEAFGPGRRTLARTVLALGVLGVIVAVTLYGTGLVNNTAKYSDAPSAGGQEKQKENEGDFSEGRADGEVIENSDSGKWPPAAAPDSELQVLSIKAVAETSISISVDGGEVEKYRLAPKDYLELAAYKSFRISISDPASVKIRFNGNPVSIAAGEGRKAEIFLTGKNEDGK